MVSNATDHRRRPGEVPGGALADRLGAKNVMTCALGLSALCCWGAPTLEMEKQNVAGRGQNSVSRRFAGLNQKTSGTHAMLNVEYIIHHFSVYSNFSMTSNFSDPQRVRFSDPRLCRQHGRVGPLVHHDAHGQCAG